MTWYIDQGPESDVVISSRIRLARNLENYPFPQRMNDQQARLAADEIVSAFYNCDEEQRHRYVTVDLDSLNEVDRQALAEKHLISEELAQAGRNHRVIISRDEAISIMINEEDHIRIQSMQAGLNLEGAFQAAAQTALVLENQLTLAYNDRYGFLTACPTNTGTGMRASAMAHLPGLVMAGRIRNIVDSLSKMSFAVRGFYGEGSKSQGDMFQISNQLTLGLSEDDLITDLKRMLAVLIEQERKARRELYGQRPLYVEDKIMRSMGLLRHSRLMSAEEALTLFSDLRLGLALGLVHGLTAADINRLMANIGPGSIQKSEGKLMTPEERDAARAQAIRNLLATSPDA
jgi:protein arginine kinase